MVSSRSVIIYFFKNSRVSLAQLVRFLMVELTYLGLNLKFDMNGIFMVNYSFSERRCSYR
jgi:hypothetical protein